jgi:GntR family transcriptional regulator
MDCSEKVCFNMLMRPESPTFSPLYRQIKNLMLNALESAEWRPGQAIPSEQELALRFNVSQGTVRKAIDEMAAENLLVRKQGKGTYVASHNDPAGSVPLPAACPCGW